MLIPTCRANRTLYWLCVTTLAGSQTNGYSRRAIPSVEAEVAQPTWMIRHISQAIKLIGRRSTRAAISPGMTRVVLLLAAAGGSCAIAVLLAAIRYQGVGGVKRGIAAPTADVEGARSQSAMLVMHGPALGSARTGT